MSPYARTMWTLIAAMILWSPACLQAIGGHMDATVAGLYFLGALFLAYMGTGVLDMIVTNYRRTAEQVEDTKRRIEFMEKKAAAEQRRRSTDSAEKTAD